MAENPCRVLLVDGHPGVRMGLRAGVDGFGHCQVVGEAASSDEALFLCQKRGPDVILLDINMQGIGGLESILETRRSVR